MIRFIEELSMNAWPSLHTQLYDGWVLRIANGYTKRANSISPLYQSRKNMDDKIEYCEDLYKSMNMDVIFKINSNPQLQLLDEMLDERGYNHIDTTSVQLLDLKNLKEIEIDDNTYLESNYSNRWANEFIICRDITHGETVKTMKSMLSKISDETIWCTYRVGPSSVGFGYGVICDGYIGLFDLYVDDFYRERGIGQKIIEAILLKAKTRGATKAYLQVVKENKPAISLYSRLGFEEEYSYWYRKLPRE